MVTQQEARDMWAAIQQFQVADSAQVQVEHDAKVAVAEAWWDTIKPAVPNTRDEALAAFRFIEAEIITQTNNFENETDRVQKEVFQFRIVLLRNKLQLANEKYKERKRNG